jgi:hypothetical protein
MEPILTWRECLGPSLGSEHLAQDDRPRNQRIRFSIRSAKEFS